jgi:hypothetical protein
MTIVVSGREPGVGRFVITQIIGMRNFRFRVEAFPENAQCELATWRYAESLVDALMILKTKYGFFARGITHV